MERIPTNIKGFDDLIQGGLPKASSILLTGQAGSGTTLFAGEYLYRNDATSLYYTFERDKNEIIQEYSSFNWNIEEKIKQKQFNIIKNELYQFETFVSNLEDNTDKLNATKVVIDSLTIIGQFFDDEYKLREGLIELKNMIKKTGATALFLSEIPAGSQKLSTFGLEEFVLDGVIKLDLTQKGSELIRTISVRKMIGTAQDTSTHPLELTPQGLKIPKIREII